MRVQFAPGLLMPVKPFAHSGFDLASGPDLTGFWIYYGNPVERNDIPWAKFNEAWRFEIYQYANP